MKKYRIGDFARELGVTPDFLKYCERKGVITPQVEENGYRYYEFTQAAPVIEYMKLKNQGFTGEEIRDVLHESSFEACLARTESLRTEIERRITFDQALLRYYDQLKEISGYFRKEPVWQVRRTRTFYFLPHSVGFEFIGDDAIRDCVRAWNPYMPLVMSARRLPVTGGEKQLSWGFAVDAEFARSVGLPTPPPVELVPSSRTLEVFLVRDLRREAPHGQSVVEEIMAKNGMRPAGDAYCKVITKIWEDGVRREYSVLYVPIEG